MLYVKPYFYDAFVCKAGDCNDTCCAGWEITVDDKSLNYYKSAGCPISAEIMSGVKRNAEGEAVFCLKESARCFFLRDDGLCRIYSECGADALCDICSEHPRFYNFYNDCEEQGLGLCCEKVCELLFKDKRHFCCIKNGASNDDDYNYLSSIREECFKIIEADKDFSLCIKKLLLYVAENSEYTSAQLKENLSKNNLFRSVMQLFGKTEPINDEWTNLVFEMTDKADELLFISDNTSFDDTEYRKLLAYLLYRHFIESAYSTDLLNGVSFVVASIIFVHMCDCLTYQKNNKFEISDRINNVKLFSKQIEYSSENTEFITDESLGILFDKVI